MGYQTVMYDSVSVYMTLFLGKMCVDACCVSRCPAATCLVRKTNGSKKKVDILVSWEEWVVCLWQMLFCYLNKTFFSVGLFLGGCGRVIVQTFCDGDLC